LTALDAVDQLQRIVDAYTARTGDTPDWAALIGARLLRGVPVDPTGIAYDLAAGRVGLSRQSRLWPPPEEPAGVAPAAR
jgi:hypothetical protein